MALRDVITGAGQSVTIMIGAGGGVGIEVLGTWTGTLQFEATVDQTFAALNCTPPNSASAVTSTAANGTWQASVAGMHLVRVRASAWTSGTATIGLHVSKAAPAGGGGGGGGGAVTIADGADVAEGATTDVAVTGDNTGTVGAKIRGLNKIFADVWDSVNHWLKVSIQNTSLVIAGDVASSSADSGNPIKVGTKVSATLSDDTMATDGNRHDEMSDVDGTLLVRDQFPLADLLSERISNTDGASTAFTNFGATANTRNYVNAISIYRTDGATTAAYVDFRDGVAGSILWSVVLPPNGGAVVVNGGCPLFRSSVNTAVAYDVSAALTTIFISISGFKSKV